MKDKTLIYSIILQALGIAILSTCGDVGISLAVIAFVVALINVSLLF